MDTNELHPATRFEWEKMILRIRFDDLIKGNASGTRGCVRASTFKVVALAFGIHANGDGSSVYPGDATIAVETQVGLKVVKAIKAAMLDLGLMRRTAYGARRRHHNDTYQLTLPSQLLEWVRVLTPDEVKAEAFEKYLSRRHRCEGSAGSHKPSPGPGPVDAPAAGVRGPQDPAGTEDMDGFAESHGASNVGYGGSAGAGSRSPADRDTNPGPSPYEPSLDDDEVRGPVTVRARDAATLPQPWSAPVGTVGTREDAARRAPDTLGRPGTVDGGQLGRCRHNLSAARRDDGRPACALCRVEDDRASGRRPSVHAAAPHRGVAMDLPRPRVPLDDPVWPSGHDPAPRPSS